MPEIDEHLKKFPRKSISHLIPHSSHIAVDLIHKMLEIIPEKRITLE